MVDKSDFLACNSTQAKALLSSPQRAEIFLR